MAKAPYSGVSPATRKGLIDSGAMEKSDFLPDAPAAPAAKSVIARDKTRQVTASEYAKQLKDVKKKAEAGYAAYVKRGKKPR
jgi:hypothetical protein